PQPDSAARGAAAKPDTAKPAYRIEKLTASGKARTLYRMDPSDSARARGDLHPAIHYVSAASIVLQWDKGEVRAMEVRGQTEGVHAEPAAPLPDSARARADSARARAGTARVGAATRTGAPVGSPGPAPGSASGPRADAEPPKRRSYALA